MKNIKTSDLLDLLKADTRQVILEAKTILQNDPETLTRQPAPGKWSVAQALEHLNTYGRYYIPVIRKALAENDLKPDSLYSSGWLGEFFTNSMKPTADKRIKNKVKSMKDYTPGPELDSKKVLDEFLAQQFQILELLEASSNKNISRIRIPITISRFIRIKLGDTFRFVIGHNQRHMIQCQNTLRALEVSTAQFA